MPEVCYTKPSVTRWIFPPIFFWLGMSLRTSCSLNPLILHTATFFVTQFTKHQLLFYRNEVCSLQACWLPAKHSTWIVSEQFGWGFQDSPEED